MRLLTGVMGGGDGGGGKVGKCIVIRVTMYDMI